MPERFAPRQAIETLACDPFRQHARGLVVGLDLAALLAERDGAEPAQAARTQAPGRRVERDLVTRRDAVTEMRLDLRKRQRRRQQDAALRGGAGDLADREIGFARQRRRLVDGGAAPVGEQERSAGAAAAGDAVGIGEREQHTGREIFAVTQILASMLLSTRRLSPLPSPIRRARTAGGVGGGG